MSFRSVEDPTGLRRVLEAILFIEPDLELPALLRYVIEEARAMTGARYGAIGVLDCERTALTEFITVGLAPEEDIEFGPRSTGKGLLGLLMADPRPLRMPVVGPQPDRPGLFAGTLPTGSYLGVPIKLRTEVYGNLYLTDKATWSEFTSDDLGLVEALAIAAGIAVENARLHVRASAAAVHDDRDRLARDLHDTIIQRLFGIGLSLQSLAGDSVSSKTSERLTAAVGDIDDIIRQLRTTIFELGPSEAASGIRLAVSSMLDGLRPVVGFKIQTCFEGAVDAVICERVAEHLLPTLREAVTNVERHADATRADVTLSVGDGLCRLRVVDDGRGMAGVDDCRGGHGLANMRRRAEKLHGQLSVDNPANGGTALVWQVPLLS